MTSVLNHRQLLNGSKWLLMVLLLASLGCKAKKANVPPYQPPTAAPGEQEVEIETSALPQNQLFYPTADPFRVGLFFPALRDSSGQLLHQIDAVDALAGAMLAFDSLFRMGFRAEVVAGWYDGLNDLEAKRSEYDWVMSLQAGHLVVYFDTLKWLINPPMEAHTQRLANHWKSKATQTLVVHRGSQVEQLIVTAFTAAMPKARVLLTERTDMAWWEKQLRTDKTNYVYLCSPDERYVANLLRLWEKLPDNTKFILAGLPNWENFASVDGGLLNAYRTILTQADFVDEAHELSQYIRRQYPLHFEGEAREMVFKAFDVAFYFGQLSAFKQLVPGSDKLSSIDLQFEPLSDAIQQNQAVRLIQLIDFQFQLLP